MKAHDAGTPPHSPAGRHDSEAGAPCRETRDHQNGDHQYGRRVERDGSWSIYHVFTGAPVEIRGVPTTGLTRGCATEGMLSLNSLNERHAGERGNPLTGRQSGQNHACLS